jgi:hypothetical protein
MKRIAVTGLTGQVVSSLIERAPRGVEMLALGRPRELPHAGDPPWHATCFNSDR